MLSERVGGEVGTSGPVGCSRRWPAVALAMAVVLGGCASGDEPVAGEGSDPSGEHAVDGVDGTDADEATGDGDDDATGRDDPADDDPAADDPAADDPAADDPAADDPADVTTAQAEGADRGGVALGELTGAQLEEHLARRYEAFWLAFDEAREAPSADPGAGHPALAELATGAQLEQAYTELNDMVTSGRAQREPDVAAVPGLDHEQSIRIRVDQVEGGAAELAVCLVNDRVSYEVDGGAIINDQVVTVAAEATMVHADGDWKLLRSRAVGLESGVAGCWNEGTEVYPW